MPQNLVDNTRKPLLALLLTGFCFLFFSCTARTPAPAPTGPKLLRWVVSGAPVSLDWTECEDRLCWQHANLVGRGLLRVPASPTPEPQVALSLAREIESVSKTLVRIRIKQGERWSNGDPLVSDDFVAAWRRSFKNCHRAGFPAPLLEVRGARAYCEGKVPFAEVGVTAPDPETLELHLDRPVPLLRLALAHPASWPVPVRRPKGQHVALGPFRVEDPKSTHLRYVRNPHYSGPELGFDGIERIAMPSLSARSQLFLEGGADLVEGVSSELCLDRDFRNACRRRFEGEIVVLVFQSQRRPFHQLAARRAFSLALRRDEIARLEARDGLAEESIPSLAPRPTGFFRLGLLSGTSREEPLDAWPAKRAGESRPPLAWSPGQGLEAIAENLQAQWLRSLRLKVDLQGPLGTRPAGLSAPPALLVARLPVNRLTALETLSAIRAQSGEAAPHVRGRALDDALENARKAETEAELASALTEAEEILTSREVLFYPLLARHRLDLESSAVESVGYDTFRLWDPVSVRLR